MEKQIKSRIEIESVVFFYGTGPATMVSPQMTVQFTIHPAVGVTDNPATANYQGPVNAVAAQTLKNEIDRMVAGFIDSESNPGFDCEPNMIVDAVLVSLEYKNGGGSSIRMPVDSNEPADVNDALLAAVNAAVERWTAKQSLAGDGS